MPTIPSLLNDGAPVAMVVLGLALLGRGWLLSRPLQGQRSRSGAIEQALATIPPAVVQPEPAAPLRSLHDAPTARLAIEDDVHSVAAEDATVFDSIATLRAKLRMVEQKPRRIVRAN